MPELNEFLHGFNLIKDTNYGGYIIEKIDASHQAVVKYREYKYPITLYFRKTDRRTNKEQLMLALNLEINKQHIIYGIRNPYRCVIQFQSLNDNGDNVVVKLMGLSYRAN